MEIYILLTWMVVEGETLWIKLFSGYTWYMFNNKTQKIFR